MSQRSDDLKLLVDVLQLEHLTQEQRDAFSDMQDVLDSNETWVLKDKQRSWVKGVLGVPEYENLITSGKAPRGREVPTIEALKPENLPKRPPTRRRED
jgi:hypothetical protein